MPTGIKPFASEFGVKPQRRHEYWAAVPVVARIIDMLQPRRDVNTAPNMCGVIGFYDIFASVAKRAVA